MKRALGRAESQTGVRALWVVMLFKGERAWYDGGWGSGAVLDAGIAGDYYDY